VWLSKGEECPSLVFKKRGGSTIGFERESALSKCVTYLHIVPCSNWEKEGGPTTALCFTSLETFLKIMNTKLNMILE
jgi:hypothetical protein